MKTNRTFQIPYRSPKYLQPSRVSRSENNCFLDWEQKPARAIVEVHKSTAGLGTEKAETVALAFCRALEAEGLLRSISLEGTKGSTAFFRGGHGLGCETPRL